MPTVGWDVPLDAIVSPPLMLRWVEAQPMDDFGAAALAEIDPRRLGDNDLPRYVAECDRAESFFAARKAEGARALAARLHHDDGISCGRAAPEVAIALRLPLQTAQREVAYAQFLASHLPETRRQFGEGKLTRWHVNEIVEACVGLTQEECARVEEQLHPCDSMSASEVRRWLHRFVPRIKPKDHAEQHAEEAKKTDVTVEPSRQGSMGWVTAYGPLHEAQLVKKAADAYAIAAKKQGDKRRLGQLRWEFFVQHAKDYLTGKTTDGHAPREHGRPIVIDVTITPESLAGLSDLPGEIPGIGPIPAGVVREMVKDALVRLQLIDPETGRLILRTKTYRPTVAQHALSDATYVRSVGPFSNVPAERSDTDHNVPHPVGKTSSDNLAPFDRGWHRAKTFYGVTAKQLPDGMIEWATPLGQTLRVKPYDYRLGP